MNDPRVEAIRACTLVGRGSCSIVDEGFSDDDELIVWLDDNRAIDPKGSVKFARDTEEIHLEQAQETRWGGDDDPQMKAMDAWRIQRKDVEDREGARA